MSNEISHQKIYKLSEIVEFIGKKISVSELTTDQYISTENMLPNRGGVVEATALPETSRVNQFEIGDTLFSNIRTYFRKVWQAEFDGGASPDVLIFRSRDKQILDPSYLYYLISDEKFIEYSNLTSKGAKMPRGDKAALMLFQTALPSLDEQKKIAGHLKILDDKIRLNTQTNRTLEQIAQALFKSWFIDFDPVKAKAAVLAEGGSAAAAERAAMRAISGKSDAELDEMQQTQAQAYQQLAATAALFPCEMEDSELGEIPKGWEVSTIGESVETVGGATPSTKNKEFWEGGDIHWTTPKDLSDLADNILIETERKITPSGLKKISSGLLPIDTVLMSSRAPVGYLALTKVPVAINQGYIAIKASGHLNCYYMLQWCKANMSEIKGRASGTTFAEISKSTFREILILIPQENILVIFSEKLTDIYKKILANINESKVLQQTRDALLPQLLSGSLPLPDEAV